MSTEELEKRLQVKKLGTMTKRKVQQLQKRYTVSGSLCLSAIGDNDCYKGERGPQRRPQRKHRRLLKELGEPRKELEGPQRELGGPQDVDLEMG